MAAKTYKFKWQPNFASETNYPSENWIPHKAVKAIRYEDNSFYYSRTIKVYVIKNVELEKYPKFWLRNTGEHECVIVVPDTEHDFSLLGKPYNFFHSKDFIVCRVYRSNDGNPVWESFIKYGIHGIHLESDVHNYAVLIPLDNQVKSSQKIFTSLEEMREVNKAADEKAKAKRDAEKLLKEETNNGPIDFATPLYEIISINKRTDIVPGAKVGDTLQGKIKMLDADGKNLMAKAKSSYVSYVDLYLNDKCIKSIPMNIFSAMMAFNFKIKQK